MDAFDQMIDEIEMLCQSNKIRKCSLKSIDSNEEKSEEENKDDNDDKICNICCYLEKDA